MISKLKASITKRRVIKKMRQYARNTVEQLPEITKAPVLAEPFIDRFIDQLGGVRISTLIENKSDMPKNADYYFREKNMIIELKSLEAD